MEAILGEMVRGKGGIFIEMARELAVKMILEIFSDNETNFELCTNSGGVVGNGGEIGWIGRGRRTSRRHSSIKELLPPGRGSAGVAQQCPVGK